MTSLLPLSHISAQFGTVGALQRVPLLSFWTPLAKRWVTSLQDSYMLNLRAWLDEVAFNFKVTPWKTQYKAQTKTIWSHHEVPTCFRRSWTPEESSSVLWRSLSNGCTFLPGLALGCHVWSDVQVDCTVHDVGWLVHPLAIVLALFVSAPRSCSEPRRVRSVNFQMVS